MMENKQLRRADFVTAILLLIMGLWIWIEAFGMPMKDSYGGVQNVWYVSPALFPLIISAAIMILACFLLINALRSIGSAGFTEWKAQLARTIAERAGLSEASKRFVGIVLLFITFVFLFIPRVDFFLASVLFLFSFIIMFHYDNDAVYHRLLRVYLAGCTLFLLYFWTGLSGLAEEAFPYSTDVLLLLSIILFTSYARLQAKAVDSGRKKFHISLLLAVVVPLFLTPVFRYFLLVPLPTEGGIIKLMNLIYYTIF